MNKWVYILLCVLLASVGLVSAQSGYVKGPQQKRLIVFVNGVLGDGTSTWTHSNGAYWPALIAKDTDFSDADIYVHTFVSPPITTAQNIEELAGRMADYLQTDGVFQKHEEVIFLCHSMGGLVTRAMILRARLSPKKVPMIYFFGTPTAGANVAGLALVVSRNPQFKHMLPLKEEGYLTQLLDRWLDTSDDPTTNYPNSIQSFCSYEKKDTYGVRIVEQHSAVMLCNRRLRAVLADHIDIVKPESNASEPYRYFKAAYLQLFRQSGPVIAVGLSTGQFDQRHVVERLTSAGYTESQLPRDWLFGPKPTLAVRQQWVPIEDKEIVPCGAVKRGKTSVALSVQPDQEVIAADITSGGKGFERIGVGIESISEKEVNVAFKLVAPKKTSRECGAPQVVWAELKYVVSRANKAFGLFGYDLPNELLSPR